jgi:rubrerythrin
MTDHITVEMIDTNADGDTRADMFRKAAVGGGTLLAGGVLLGGLPELAEARKSKKQDVKILNFALTLEYLEAEFYTQAVAKGGLSGPTLQFATTVRDHENAHVKFLKGVLKSKAVEKPTFDFKDTVTNQAKFQATAIVLEDTGVSAYEGQAHRIKQTSVLMAAASVLPVEARHAAWIRNIVGQPPAPVAFDKAASMKKVLSAVKGTGFIVG